MTTEPRRSLKLSNGGWPWASTICALHGLLIFALVYGGLIVPKFAQMLPLNVDAVLWLHWLWLGWPITGAWRGTRYALGAKIPFCIGFMAWIASCFFAAFYTLMLFGAHT